MSFGYYLRGICGGTPAEIVHAVSLGLCQYVVKGVDLTFTQSTLDQMSHFVVGIYNDSKHQSERDIPHLGPF